MRKILAGAIALALGSVAHGFAQSLDELNVQIHGYATQGFLYTSQNNILTTHSSDGSPAWTEAVLNIGAQPIPKLRIAVQGRFFLLGNYGNAITLDWAAADYKADERLGVRFGKVKIPSGLFNETQDIDPSYQWALLPQSVYPLSSRNSILALYGGVVYGTLNGGKLGKLEYRGWSGESIIAGSDGYLLSLVEEGFAFPNGLNDFENGAALHWRTPLSGLMIGASDIRDNADKNAATTPYGPGSLIGAASNHPAFFARYEKQKLMVAFEYVRLQENVALQLPGPTTPASNNDQRGLYGMATYKVTDKLTVGVYDSQANNHTPGTVLGPAKYSKDWAFSGRYDFGQYLYAKAEEHIIDGTAIGYDTALNPYGLKPNTKLTILKIGVSF